MNKIILIVLLAMISCQLSTNQEPTNNIKIEPKENQTDSTEYQSQLVTNKIIRLIDSLIKAPLIEGDMSTYEKSGYGIRAKLTDSLMKDLMTQFMFIHQYKVLTLKDQNDHKAESDSISSNSPNVPKYYILYSNEVKKRKIGCIDPIAIVGDYETEGFEELHKSIAVNIHNYCNVKIKSVVLFLDFEGDNLTSEMDTDCRWIRRINVNINPYSEQEIKLPMNLKCSLQKGKAEVLEYKKEDGERIKTGAGAYYQYRKESNYQK